MKTEANSPINAATETKVITIGHRDFDEQVFHQGLTKREYFAAMAMQGICTNFSNQEGHELDIAENFARQAVKCADALIAELNRT